MCVRSTSLGAIMNSKAILATAVALLCASGSPAARADNLTYEWYTAANNGDVIPTDSSSNCGSCHEDMASSGGQVSAGTKVFNSYNQPAINKEGVVVFRARSRGGHGGSEGGEGGSGHGGGEDGGTGGARACAPAVAARAAVRAAVAPAVAAWAAAVAASRSAASTCAIWPSRGRCTWCSGAVARCRNRTIRRPERAASLQPSTSSRLCRVSTPVPTRSRRAGSRHPSGPT